MQSMILEFRENKGNFYYALITVAKGTKTEQKLGTLIKDHLDLYLEELRQSIYDGEIENGN